MSTKQLLLQIIHYLPHVGIHFHAVFHEPAGVQYSTMVPSAKRFTDCIERTFSQIAREKHCYLPRKRDVFRPPLARHVRQPDIEMFGNLLLNDLNTDGKT